jgi:hypothetical protein
LEIKKFCIEQQKCQRCFKHTDKCTIGLVSCYTYELVCHCLRCNKAYVKEFSHFNWYKYIGFFDIKEAEKLCILI